MDSHCSYLERSLLWRISRTATLRLYIKFSFFGGPETSMVTGYYGGNVC